MNDFDFNPISTPQDALLYLDFLVRFSAGDTRHFSGIATVIRDLMLRLEVQAAAMERDEARRVGA